MSNTAALVPAPPAAHGAPGAPGTELRENSPGSTAAALEQVSLKTWVAVVGSTIGAFLAILNIQVVGASLADIQGGIGAGIDDGGWITTSYLIAEIIVIPLSGWLASVFSLRTYLLTSTALFLALTAACAFAQTLGQMIVIRAGQGFGGGVLIPPPFSIIMTKLPPSRPPFGLAIYSIAVVFAPSIGPALGGYFSDNFGWQSIFFLSLPPGLVMIAMLWYALPPSRVSSISWPTAIGSVYSRWHWASAVWRRCSRKAIKTTGSVRHSSCVSRWS